MRKAHQALGCGRLGSLLALLCLAACAGSPVPPRGSSDAPSTTTPSNWPLPPQQVEQRLSQEKIELRAVKPIAEGTTGVMKLELFFPATGDTIAFKWKSVPEMDADGWNNAPRKELAAYVIQSWFLEPADYVVPTIGVRCLSLDALREHGITAKPNMAGTNCLLGVLSVWLENVKVPDRVLDTERFADDAHYATLVGRLNLLTYLVEHQDGRAGNILASSDPEDPRLFSVDNGISFAAPIKNVFVTNWNTLRVPAVPKAEIERLRAVKVGEIEKLGVLLEMRAGKDGVLRRVNAGPNRDPDDGARVAPGWLQLGLTRAEIDGLEVRLNELLTRVDAGEIPVF
jgi:hypothetical protein